MLVVLPTAAHCSRDVAKSASSIIGKNDQQEGFTSQTPKPTESRKDQMCQRKHKTLNLIFTIHHAKNRPRTYSRVP
jgi:hypothetical protein